MKSFINVAFSKLDSSVVDETDSGAAVVFSLKFVVSILNLQSEVEVTTQSQSDGEDRDLKYPAVWLTSLEDETWHSAILFSLFWPSSPCWLSHSVLVSPFIIRPVASPVHTTHHTTTSLCASSLCVPLYRENHYSTGAWNVLYIIGVLWLRNKE